MPSDGWREAQASALDAQAAVIAAALAALDDAEAVLEQRARDRPLGELRALAASLRAEASEMTADARQLRAHGTGRDGRGFPLQLTAPATTRHPRGAPP